MQTPEQHSKLLTQVIQFRADLLRQGALAETELGGHRPAHYGQAAEALLLLEDALATNAPISPDVMSSVFRGFCRANELSQPTREELATFSAIQRTAEQMGTGA